MKKPLLFTLLLIALTALSGTESPKNPTPNIILIFLDDMGYGDLTITGATDYETPNIDRLAAEGIRFTNFVTAQAVCSASRAALLTGCYPNRLSLSGALMPDSKVGIHSDETTLAELLKQKNYATAIYGKWHLGHHKPFLPLQNGFDEYFGLPYSNDMVPLWYDGTPAPVKHNKSRYPKLPLIQNNDKVEELNQLSDQEKLTTLYTEKAVDFIKKNQKKPFFIYLPHSMPHVPLAVSSKFKGKSKQGLYGDVMMEIDWSVGEIMKALKAANLDKNTLVIFTSDNGPWLNYGNHAGSSAGFREGKGTIYEGGHRVPCIMRWKGAITEGGISNKLAATLDIFPTIASICNLKLPDHTIDGVDISPILKGNTEATPRRYFYYYYNRNALKAVRRDDWKLILPHKSRTYLDNLPGNNGFPGAAPEDKAVSGGLYDLRRDKGECYDVSKLYPEIVAELTKVAEAAREDLGDELTDKAGKNRRKVGQIE